MGTVYKIFIVGLGICFASSALAEDQMSDNDASAVTASCTVDKAGHAKLVGHPRADLIKLLKKWPQGGGSLTDELVEVLDLDPNRAAELVALSLGANKKQKAAIARALFEVDRRLHKASPKTITPIMTVLPCADPDLRAAISAIDVGNNSGDEHSGGEPGRPFGFGATGSNGAVSPN